MNKLLLYLMSVAILMANNNYPEVFSQLGTPLYKADKAFAKLPINQQYSSDVSNYHQSQVKALELYKQGDNPAYFKALRALNEKHDKIVSSVKRELSNAIKNKDYNYFLSLSNAGLDTLYKQESFKALNYEYYIQNRTHGESEYLEKRIKTEQAYDKRYGIDISGQGYTSSPSTSHHKVQKRLVLLSTTWCGACKKAKRSLKEEGIRYIEYDAEKSSKGRSLMNKFHGTGYPTFIIGNDSTSGYSLSWIKQRL